MNFCVDNFEKLHGVQPEFELNGVSQSSNLKNNTIAFALQVDNDLINALKLKKSIVIFIPLNTNLPQECSTNNLILECVNPRYEYIKTTRHVFKQDNVSIEHELNYVHPTAKIGKSVVLSPFTYIGPNCIIEDDCNIFPGAKILSKVKIGKGTQIGSNTVIGGIGFGIEQGVVSREEGVEMEKEFDDMLQERLAEAKQIEKAKITNFLEEVWKDFRKSKKEDFVKSPDTGYDEKKLIQLAKKINYLPEGKKYFRKILKLFDDRLAMLESDKLDWAMGELLAYATLLQDGYSVRISGQDVERGTFSHRHAVVKTEDDEEEVIPLSLISEDQGKFDIYNSLLSEYAVLGFDYGYSFNTPNGLTIWEAQFGDFFNGAQIIIDQFLSAAEDKWGTPNGLVMLLPHGYEGMGSEHSSGRMERFLQLCAEYNMQVVNCTTPSNYFHLLRRQQMRPFRKPLVVFTPKKLLRYPRAVSSIKELANGCFSEVIDDHSAEAKKVDTVVLCSK